MGGDGGMSPSQDDLGWGKVFGNPGILGQGGYVTHPRMGEGTLESHDTWTGGGGGGHPSQDVGKVLWRVNTYLYTCTCTSRLAQNAVIPRKYMDMSWRLWISPVIRAS